MSLSPSLKYFFVLDFEATCDEPQNPTDREIIEFPITLYRRDDGIVSEFREFVRPTINPLLSSFCTLLTGIRQDDVDNASTFVPVYLRANQWVQDMIKQHSMTFEIYTMVTCGDWDLQTQMPKELSRHSELQLCAHFQKWINLKSLFLNSSNLDWSDRRFDIPDMLMYLSKPLLGKHHSGIDDTRNMVTILHEIITKSD